jgi:hypothetical protein
MTDGLRNPGGQSQQLKSLSDITVFFNKDDVKSQEEHRNAMSVDFIPGWFHMFFPDGSTISLQTEDIVRVETKTRKIPMVPAPDQGDMN